METKSNMQKWVCAVVLTVLFVVVSLPQTYDFVDGLLRGVVGPVANNGLPTTTGLVVHSLLFLLLARLLMMEGVKRALMMA